MKGFWTKVQFLFGLGYRRHSCLQELIHYLGFYNIENVVGGRGSEKIFSDMLEKSKQHDGKNTTNSITHRTIFDSFLISLSYPLNFCPDSFKIF